MTQDKSTAPEKQKSPEFQSQIESISPCLVIGAGLIGASIGCVLTEQRVRVHLSDLLTAHAVVAAGRGAGVLDAPVPEQVKLVIVAVPPESIAAVVTDALATYPNAAVTDVGSVKGMILRQLADAPQAERYVGSHPMAGSALTGPLTAGSDLFEDRTWVVTPQPRNPQWALDRVFTLAKLSGARVVSRSASDHDRAVAEISHVPQLMSSLTAARLVGVADEDLQLAGQGVRDVTRIAASDPALWRQIVAGNTDYIRELLLAVQADLAELIDGLDDPQTVSDLVRRGNDGVHALPGRKGKRADELGSVRFEIPDAPGAMARLFADIDATGINIEDASVEHDPTRAAGYMVIGVAPDDVNTLRESMRKRGWVNVGAAGKETHLSGSGS